MKHNQPPLEIHHRFINKTSLDPLGLILLEKVKYGFGPFPHGLNQMARKGVKRIIYIKESHPQSFKLLFVDLI